MRNEIICELTRDLLPSYLEGLTSPASSEAIERHALPARKLQKI